MVQHQSYLFYHFQLLADRLRLWLHESLLDLEKPVKVTINGKAVTTFNPKLDTGTMAESLLAFDDPECIYASKMDVVVP